MLSQFGVGDSHYARTRVETVCNQTNRILIASSGKRKRRSEDSGREVWKIFHQLRSHSIENFNEQFKGIFDAHRAVPTKGWKRTGLWAIGSILVYQLLLLYQYESKQP